jgi:protein-S-isoprenylcysteine O-methyltransferase Ste14
MNIGIAAGNAWLPLDLSLVAFGSFAWSLRGHFASSGRIPNGMRLLSLLSLAAYVHFLASLTAGPGEATLWTALGLLGVSASVGLFWWSVATTREHRPFLAYTDADPDTIYCSGPYAFVRHPFYVSYIIFWIGTALVAGGLQWVPAIALASWYMWIAQREERRLRSSALSAAYASYQKRTTMAPLRLAAAAAGRLVEVRNAKSSHALYSLSLLPVAPLRTPGCELRQRLA